MSLAKRLGIWLGVLACALPMAMQAQGGCLLDPCSWCGLFDCCCTPCFTCHLSPMQCCCPPPLPVMAPQPVFQTQYRQEQFVTYRDVPRVQYRREEFTENVPVTTFTPVTVDEGSYQWVPKLVTKNVPQTVYQPQTRYRDVAVQVNERVAETHTRLVPQQTVSFMPQVQPIASSCCGGNLPVAPYPAVGFAAPPIVAPPVPPSTPAYYTAPGPVQPYLGPQATLPGEVVRPAPAQPDHAPEPPSEWSTIRSRRSSMTSPGPMVTPIKIEGAQSRFRPAPSAAAVWMSATRTTP